MRLQQECYKRREATMSENASVEWGNTEHLRLSMEYLRQQIYCIHLTNQALSEKKGEVLTAAKAFL